MLRAPVLITGGGEGCSRSNFLWIFPFLSQVETEEGTWFLLFQLLTVMGKTCNSSQDISLMSWASIKILVPPSPCSSPSVGCIDLGFRCWQMITAIPSHWLLWLPGLPHYWILSRCSEMAELPTAPLWKPQIKKIYCAKLFLLLLRPIFSFCFYLSFASATTELPVHCLFPVRDNMHSPGTSCFFPSLIYHFYSCMDSKRNVFMSNI